MSISVARWISILGSPLIVVPLTVAMVSKALVLTVVLSGVALVMVAGILRKVRRGDWPNFDVSEPKDRPSALARAILVLAAAGLLLYFLGQPAQTLWGFAFAIVIMAVAAALNRFHLKVSMHAAFTSYAAVIPVVVMPALAAVLAFVAMLVAWSRIVLERHTVTEVLVGIGIGATSGVALLALR
jgi:membrane-associated phospholipid phosphatase